MRTAGWIGVLTLCVGVVGCGSEPQEAPTLTQSSNAGSDGGGSDVSAPPDADGGEPDVSPSIDTAESPDLADGGPDTGVCTDDSDCGDGEPCTIDRCEQGACVHIAGSCCTEDEQCDDDDPCTFDFCEENVCKTSPQADCCSTDEDCADDNPCTKNVCIAGVGACQAAPIAGCCTADAACADQDPCTIDACVDNACQSTSGGCCESDGDCDDGNGCTADGCGDDGQCDFVPTPGCCNNDSECDDMDPCTVDLCFGGECLSSSPGDACCMADADCEDNNPCTQNTCSDGECVTSQVGEACCAADDDCDDGNACTTGKCTEAGDCTYEPVAGCCNEDADCVDDEPCTFDLCFGNECLNSEPSEGCCETDQDCDDGNVCTIEACVQGVCSKSTVAGCCNTDVDCATDEGCQVGSCQGGTCAFAPDPACCTTAASCDDGDPCTTDTCGPEGQCNSAPVAGCCTTNDDCLDGDGCTTDTCESGTCAHAAVPDCCDATAGTEIAHFEFVPNQVDGVIFNPSSNAPYRWRESTSLPYAGTAAMYFGNGDGDAYCQESTFGGAPVGTATLPVESQPFPTGALQIPEGSQATVSFQARLDIRTQSNVDQLTLSVLTAGGQPTEVWSKGDIKAAQYGAWVAVKVDLSAFAGESIQLRFAFSVVDDDAHGGCQGDGPRIDDVRVTVADCETPKECVGGCDDGIACTQDVCVAGQCQSQPITGCCSTDPDCAADNPCLTGACVGGTCQFQVLDGDGCCQAAADCGDTSQFCGAGVTCQQSQCSVEPVDKSETLMDFVFTSQVDGWNSGQGNNYRWREIGTKSVSPSLSMYFGNQGGDHYCPIGLSPPSGVASFPGGQSPLFPTGTIAFDASGQTTLTFQVFADVRSNPDVDQLTVRLDSATSNQQTVVWTKSDLSSDEYDQWVPVTVDLTPHAPFNGRIRVIFDTVDVYTGGGCYLGGTGVHLDDLKVVHSCH